MSQPLAFKCATLTGTGSAQNLLLQLQAVDPTIGAFMAAAREIVLQADPANGTNNIWIGDDQLTSSRIGYVLTATSPGTPLVLRSSRGSDIPFSEFFFQASAGSPKLNVMILP
jgi:hypothetical protein